MKCNIMMTSFVKKTLKKSHAALVARLLIKAQILDASIRNQQISDNKITPFASSQASTEYSPSEYGPQSAVEDGPPGSPGFAQYRIQTPPTGRTPDFPDFRERTNSGHDDSLYPQALSMRSSNTSWNSSAAGSQRGRTPPPQAGSHSSQRVSWQNLNTQRTPSILQIDPQQNRNPSPYQAPPQQSYYGAGLHSQERERKQMPAPMSYQSQPPPQHGPVELE